MGDCCRTITIWDDKVQERHTLGFCRRTHMSLDFHDFGDLSSNNLQTSIKSLSPRIQDNFLTLIAAIYLCTVCHPILLGIFFVCGKNKNTFRKECKLHAHLTHTVLVPIILVKTRGFIGYHINAIARGCPNILSTENG